jgi:hypothetical protein
MLTSHSRIGASDGARPSGPRGPEALVPIPDVPGPHEACISLESAPHASEPLLALPVGRLPVVPPGTSAARVPRIYVGDPDAPERGLVADQRSEPSEGPRGEPPPGSEAPGFCSVPQVREVLKDDRIAGLARPDQPVRNLVVAVEAETSQPAPDHGEASLERRPVTSVRTGVEPDGRVVGPESGDRLALLLAHSSGLGSLDRHSAGGDHELTGKVERGPEGMVGLLVKFIPMDSLGLPPGFRDPIESFGVLTNRPREGLRLMGGQAQPSRAVC